MQEIKLNSQLKPSLIEKQDNGLKESQLDMVTFQLDRQVYTLPISIISQVIDLVAITPIPEGNDAIEGIFNYHGTTVPVVDLRHYLNLTKIPIHLHTPIILIAFSGQIIGLIVDKVIDVVSYPRQAILPPEDLLPENLGKIPILDGVIQSPEGFLMLLNLEQLFSLQQKQGITEALDNLTKRPQRFSKNQKSTNPTNISSPEITPAQDKQEDANRVENHEVPHKRSQKQRRKTDSHAPARLVSSHKSNTSITQEGMA